MHLTWILVLALSAVPDAPSTAPALEILHKPLGQPRSGSGATLVVNALSDAQRARLAQSLQALAASAARHSNPFYVAIDDADERAAVEKLLGETLPLFTAARTLIAGWWQSSDGDLTVRGVSRCARHARCVPLAGPKTDDAIAARARFLAWPLGYAVLLRAPSPDQARKAAELLRADPSSPQIGLVLTGEELHQLRKNPASDGITKSARLLAAKRPDLPFADTVRALAEARKDELPWLKLPAGCVLIVPRLSALSAHARFVNDVRTRLDATKVEWLAQPE